MESKLIITWIINKNKIKITKLYNKNENTKILLQENIPNIGQYEKLLKDETNVNNIRFKTKVMREKHKYSKINN